VGTPLDLGFWCQPTMRSRIELPSGLRQIAKAPESLILPGADGRLMDPDTEVEETIRNYPVRQPILWLR
jgi:hypothetical protein